MILLPSLEDLDRIMADPDLLKASSSYPLEYGSCTCEVYCECD